MPSPSSLNADRPAAADPISPRMFMRSPTGFGAISVLGALMVLAAMVGVKPPMLADSEVDASPPTDPSPAPFNLATVHPGDGTMVGVAKPSILNFAAPITDRPTAEDPLHIPSTPSVPGTF